MMNKIKQEINKYRKGIMAGALVGFAFGIWSKLQGQDFSYAMQGRAGIDMILSNIPDPTMAFIKVLMSLVIFGALAGYIIDKYIVSKIR